MIARELAEKLLETPDLEVTVNVLDGDYSQENEVDLVLIYGGEGGFVSIQHSKKRWDMT